MPGFRYTDAQVLDFVKTLKTIEGSKIVWSNLDKPASGAKMTLLSDQIGAASMELMFLVAKNSDPTTYKASLFVDSVRVRGVDHVRIEVRRQYKVVIPKGWHQNVNYPNMPKANRHDPLDWHPVDFEDFARKVCRLWNIKYDEQSGQISLL